MQIPLELFERFSYEIVPIGFPGLKSEEIVKWKHMERLCAVEKLYLPVSVILFINLMIHTFMRVIFNSHSLQSNYMLFINHNSFFHSLQSNVDIFPID